MIINSDITGWYPFSLSRESASGTEFVSDEKYPETEESLYKIEVSTNATKNETDIKVLKFQRLSNGASYRIKFDGMINSPKDLRDLFTWLRII
jgi:hypothetical protein